MRQGRAVRLLIASLAALVIAPAAAYAQVPLPPLPPVVGPPPEEPQPPPEAPGPVSPAPGSVTQAVTVGQTGFFADDALVPPLTLRWAVNGFAQTILAADGRVYAVLGDKLAALDQRDGHELWSAPVRASGAAYDAGIVFATVGDDIQAYKADTGQMMWSQHLLDVAFAGAPVASGGAVYVGYGQGGGTMNAYRASDGTPLWSKSTVGGADAPAIDDKRLYTGGACANAKAHDRASGEEVWVHRTGCSGGGDVTPALVDGKLWVPANEYTNDGYLDPPILNAENGQVVSRFAGVRPVFVDGLAVIGGGEAARAIDPGSGGEAWRTKKAVTSLIAVGHDVYGFRLTERRQRLVVALDSETGGEIWSAALPGEDTSSEYFTAGAAPGLLVVSSGGRVFAFESAFRPEPGEIALGADRFGITTGSSLTLTGVLGTNLRGTRPEVTIGGAAWRRGGFRALGTVRPSRDGGFVAAVTAFRNSRFRVSAGGADSNVVTVYTYPSVRLGRPRLVSRRRAVLTARVSSPRTKLGGRTLVLYLQRQGSSRLARLGSGRLRGAGRGRSKARVRFVPPRGATSRDLVYTCVKGQLRLGLGRPSPLTRRCGARKLRHP